jgi:hypothetical protein
VIFNWLNVVIQTLDFIWKSCEAYAKTPDGIEELKDITNASEALFTKESDTTKDDTVPLPMFEDEAPKKSRSLGLPR